MIVDLETARYGIYVQCAMDAFMADPTNLAPPPDPRLAPDWEVIGQLIAHDALLPQGAPLVLGGTVNYGFLARSTADPLDHLAVIRGTADTVEWIEDGEFRPVLHPVAGKVEQGFWGIHSSMALVLPGQQPAKAADAILAALGGSGRVTVVGHSLGAPLATYLTLELAYSLKGRLRGRFIASPRPGDTAFGEAFDTWVSDYRVYNYELDVVPRVPFGPDYADLPQVTWLKHGGTQARIKLNLGCHHHVLCYSAQLAYGATDWATLPAIDQSYVTCILGPIA